ncbi:MAG: TIGR01212 family radical SAM protein [Bacteroidales bacterium]|nr:TIGR01212 family radical SAM protein [Bacteroidales bacterium]
MDNSFVWGHGRPFNAYSNYMKRKYGERIQKLSIDAGFSCPNRDGKISYGGCSFCSNEAFNPSYCRDCHSISQQIEEGIKFHKWRYKKVHKYFAYFQAYSNTYAPLDILKQRYDEALSNENICGLVIGTRPDCIDEEILSYLEELNKYYHIVIEFGIESCYNSTLQAINRGHTFECTKKAIEDSKKHGLCVGGHIIFGLPTETREDMLKQADILSALPLDSIKFHQLQILKNTTMEKDYLQNTEKYHLFSYEEYKDFIISFLENLNPNIVIERFVSEVPPRYNVINTWGTKRNETIVEEIEKQMIKTNTYQGKNYKQ